MVGGKVPGLRGVDMAILLQNDQVFEEGKSNIALSFLVKIHLCNWHEFFSLLFL